jgi:phosphoglucosamine mutase
LTGGVVGTVMSNLGMERALLDLGIPFARASVGDRYVLEELKARGWQIGGEASGHIICLDRTTTGDGIVAALQVLAVSVASGKSLKELRSGMTKYPQLIANVRTRQRADLTTSVPIQRAIAKTEAQLGEEGRVILRASGTEPVIRVTVEGPDPQLVQTLTEELTAVVESEFGEAG